MLKAFAAASILAVFVLAAPVRAQSIAEAQLARDDKTCTAQGAGPETAGYNDCMAQLKTDRFQQAQKRAADLAAMPHGYRTGGPTLIDPQTGEPFMKTGPMAPNQMYLLPEGTRALQGGTLAMPTQTVTTTKVCVTEGDAAKPQTGGDESKATADNAAKPEAICNTDVVVEMKTAPRRDRRDDPTSALAHTYMHPGDVFHDHTQLGGP